MNLVDRSLCVWREPDCPLAPRCLRTMAESHEWHQSYFAPDLKGEECPYYIEQTPPALPGDESI